MSQQIVSISGKHIDSDTGLDPQEVFLETLDTRIANVNSYLKRLRIKSQMSGNETIKSKYALSAAMSELEMLQGDLLDMLQELGIDVKAHDMTCSGCPLNSLDPW